MKTCTKCRASLPKSEFFRCGHNKDGLHSWCKSCSRAAKRKGRTSRAERRAAVFPVAGVKVCSKCCQAKSLDLFASRGGKRASEPRAYCIECSKRGFRTWAVATGRQRHSSRAALLDAIHQRRHPRPGFKACLRCGKTKRYSSFQKNAAQKDGLGNQCKACRNQLEKKRRHANLALFREKQRAYIQANRERVRLLSRLGEHRRRARKMRLKEHFTKAEWLALCERYGNRCVKCGSMGKLTADHVMPISRRGRNSIDNIQPLCLTCNVRKHTRHIDYRLPLLECRHELPK